MQNDINAVRADLYVWAARQPKAVKQAVANLDGWLIQCGVPALGEVNVLACTARAVETLRRATGRSK